MLKYDINSLDSVRNAYQKASPEEQERILSEICDRKTWGYGYGYAIRLFSAKKSKSQLLQINEAIAKATVHIKWERDVRNSDYIFYIVFYPFVVHKKELFEINNTITQKYNIAIANKIVGGATLTFQFSEIPGQEELVSVSKIAIKIGSSYHHHTGALQSILNDFSKAITLLHEEELLSKQTAEHIRLLYGVNKLPSLYHLALRSLQKLIYVDKEISESDISSLPDDILSTVRGPGV